MPGSGTILAIGNADAFCSLAPSEYQCEDGTDETYMTITDSSTADASTGNRTYFWASADATSSVSRTAAFPAPSEGTYTFYLRGKTEVAPDRIGFWRGELTLVFIPH